MGDDTLVAGQLAAGAEFIRRYSATTALRTAFWLKPEGRAWVFCVAPENGPDGPSKSQFFEAFRIADGLASETGYSLPIRPLLPESKLARAAVAAADDLSTDRPTLFIGYLLGDVSIDGAYLYPPPAAARAG
ncbi:MAG: hypothetical protein ACRC7O_08015 [Fimbriiglobus sp.]